jgi:hypothetical protein
VYKAGNVASFKGEATIKPRMQVPTTLLKKPVTRSVPDQRKHKFVSEAMIHDYSRWCSMVYELIKTRCMHAFNEKLVPEADAVRKSSSVKIRARQPNTAHQATLR